MAEKSVIIEGLHFNDISKKSRKNVKQKPKSNASLKKQLIQRLAKYRKDLKEGKQLDTCERTTNDNPDTFDTTMHTLNMLEDNYQKSQNNKRSQMEPVKLDIVETDFDTHVKKVQNEPNYGCLKKGQKKTLKQIRNSQAQHNVMFQPTNTSISIDQIDHRLKERQKMFLEMKEKRKNELNHASQEQTQLQLQLYNPKHIVNTEDIKSSSGGKAKKTKKVKKIKKTCKIGKYDGKVVVLLPNKQTRKKIHDDIVQIDTIPVYKIKEYLRSKRLIKTGCTAPENILRETMKNTILSGDIEKDKECIQVTDMLEE